VRGQPIPIPEVPAVPESTGLIEISNNGLVFNEQGTQQNEFPAAHILLSPGEADGIEQDQKALTVIGVVEF
jgi:hypothetical protein